MDNNVESENSGGMALTLIELISLKSAHWADEMSLIGDEMNHTG